MRHAEEANYWSTSVHPTKSMGEALALLEDFGAETPMVAQGQAQGRPAWLVRFAWRGASYRFVFVQLECKRPDKISTFGGKRRTHREQARYQMGRRAVHFIKAILVAADDQPDALFGFIELPEVGQHPGGLPVTAAELDVSGMVSALPELTLDRGSLLLASGSEA